MDINEFYERYWELIKFRKDFVPPKIVLKAWDNYETITETDTYKILIEYISKYQNPTILDVGADEKNLKKYWILLILELFINLWIWLKMLIMITKVSSI
jgi:hypothetical protein